MIIIVLYFFPLYFQFVYIIYRHVLLLLLNCTDNHHQIIENLLRMKAIIGVFALRLLVLLLSSSLKVSLAEDVPFDPLFTNGIQQVWHTIYNFP